MHSPQGSSGGNTATETLVKNVRLAPGEYTIRAKTEKPMRELTGIRIVVRAMNRL